MDAIVARWSARGQREGAKRERAGGKAAATRETHVFIEMSASMQAPSMAAAYRASLVPQPPYAVSQDP